MHVLCSHVLRNRKLNQFSILEQLIQASVQRGLQVTDFYRIGFELDDIKAKSVMQCKCNKLICAFLQHPQKNTEIISCNENSLTTTGLSEVVFVLQNVFF